MKSCKLLNKPGLLCSSRKEFALCSRHERPALYALSCLYAVFQLSYLKLPPASLPPAELGGWRPLQPPSMRES